MLIHWVYAWADYRYRIAYWREVEVNEGFYRLIEAASARRTSPPAPPRRWRA